MTPAFLDLLFDTNANILNHHDREVSMQNADMAQMPLLVPSPDTFSFRDIHGSSVDTLVAAGVRHILATGRRVDTRSGFATQSYGVNYILTQPRHRLHLTRPGAVRYLCRELIAYFSGSLRASDGLAYASRFWETLQDDLGNINSNYGYYVFHEPVDGHKNQYDWVIKRLLANNNSRRAIININQNYHKSDTKDFPCTVCVQFFILDRLLFCEVSARSTDVVTGLSYDIGFFSFLHELVLRDLQEQGLMDVGMGSTIIKASFTQIYDRTLGKAMQGVQETDCSLQMPAICSASVVLSDIYGGNATTAIIRWIQQHAA